MIEIIRCVECDGEEIPSGGISVNVELQKHLWCDKCMTFNLEKQAFFFCSPKCFHKYMNKVERGVKQMEWKDGYGHVS